MTDPAKSHDLFDPAYERVEHVLAQLLGDPRMAGRATQQLFAKLASPAAAGATGAELPVRGLADPAPSIELALQPGLAQQPERPSDRLLAALLLSLSRLAPLERQVFFFCSLVDMSEAEVGARLGRRERKIRDTHVRVLRIIEADLASVR